MMMMMISIVEYLGLEFVDLGVGVPFLDVLYFSLLSIMMTLVVPQYSAGNQSMAVAMVDILDIDTIITEVAIAMPPYIMAV
jgi:hypothetical protein